MSDFPNPADDVGLPPVRHVGPPRRRISHENRVLWLAIAAGAVPALIAFAVLFTGDFTPKTQWTLAILMMLFWVGFASAVRSTVVRPLQTLANMQAALREGDFSMRARAAGSQDALGELMLEINELSETLRQQRLGAMEASALLGAVMSEIDVAVYAFDSQQRLRLANRAGERLLAQNVERLLGKTATELGLAECLQGESARTLEKVFPGRAGRFGMR
ncbi:MAG TPA: PAS domain-containing protein, partial [Terriglobales bacterium]|nr:PAS domain-containing protein [Terriglobales bacterium]